MFSQRKFTWVVLLMVVVLALAGAVTALAQDGDDSTPTWPHMGWGHGGYGMGMGMMGGWTDGSHPALSAAAAALNMDEATLFNELHSGKTLAELAEAQGVDQQTVQDALVAAATEHVQALVDAGRLTQEQADTMLAYMTEHWTDMPMFDGGCFGSGMMYGGMARRGHMGGMRGRWG